MLITLKRAIPNDITTIISLSKFFFFSKVFYFYKITNYQHQFPASLVSAGGLQVGYRCAKIESPELSEEPVVEALGSWRFLLVACSLGVVTWLPSRLNR